MYEIRLGKYEDMIRETKNTHKILIWETPGKLSRAIIQKNTINLMYNTSRKMYLFQSHVQRFISSTGTFIAYQLK